MYTDTSVAAWRKSRFCVGASACGELRWVTAAASNNGHCVAVASQNDEVWVRDSKLGNASPVLKFDATDWQLFVAALAANQLGTYGGPVLLVSASLNCWQMWRDGAPWVALTFDDAEVDAFVAGVEAGEFNAASLASGMHDPDGAGAARLSEPPVAVSGADSVPG